jgi:hypothetical protein
MPITNVAKNIADILSRFDQLPDDAVVPSSVTAALHNVHPKTVRRNYPSVQLSPGRYGQRVGDLRAMARGIKPTT